MDGKVRRLKVVNVAWGTEVAVSEEVELVLRGGDAPNPDVKLSSLVEEWPLDVLLHHARGPAGARVNVGHHAIQVPKYLDPSPLIRERRLHKPQVINTMLHWQLLFRDKPSLYLLKPKYHVIHLLVLMLWTYYESSGRGVKLVVLGSFAFGLGVVVLLKGPNQARFCADAF